MCITVESLPKPFLCYLAFEGCHIPAGGALLFWNSFLAVWCGQGLFCTNSFGCACWGKSIEVGNVVTDEGSLDSQKFPGGFFGLNTYLYLSSWPVQLQYFFFFSPALCRQFQCHSWECRAGSIKSFICFPKEILWCCAWFSFPSWSTSLTSRTDPSQGGLSLTGCLRICSPWTKSSLFYLALSNVNIRSKELGGAPCRWWGLVHLPSASFAIFWPTIAWVKCQREFPHGRASLFVCEVFVVFCSFLKRTLFSSSKNME